MARRTQSKSYHPPDDIRNLQMYTTHRECFSTYNKMSEVYTNIEDPNDARAWFWMVCVLGLEYDFRQLIPMLKVHARWVFSGRCAERRSSIVSRFPTPAYTEVCTSTQSLVRHITHAPPPAPMHILLSARISNPSPSRRQCDECTTWGLVHARLAHLICEREE